MDFIIIIAALLLYVIIDFFFVGYKGTKPIDKGLKALYFIFLIILIAVLTFVPESTRVGIFGLFLIQIYQEGKEKLFGNELEKLYRKIFKNRVA